MYLIRELAAKYNLTRTALLHYDAIGLLSPASRTEAGYRLYSEDDERRLQNILLFRSMGISLEDIGQILENENSRLAKVLLIQLNQLNREIEELQNRQRNIINLLREVNTLDAFKLYGVDGENGRVLFDGFDPLEWHQKFQAISPNLHEEFLKILDVVPESIRESLQAFLNGLPEEQRYRLYEIIRRE